MKSAIPHSWQSKRFPQGRKEEHFTPLYDLSAVGPIQYLQSVICWLLSVSVFRFSRIVAEKVNDVLFTRPRKYIQCSNPETAEPGYINITELAASVCRYDLDDMDIFWLQTLNEDLAEMGKLFSHK